MSLEAHKWVSLPSMPNSRAFFTTTLIEERLFVLGGCQLRGLSLPTADYYDFSAKQWFSLPDMPTKKAAPSVQCIDKKLYLFGGVGEDSKACSTIEYLDLGAQQWVSLNGLPEKLQGVSVLQRGGKVLLVGGMRPDMSASHSFRCFDPTRGTCASLPSLPTARSKAGVFLLNEKLYVLGGAQGRTPVSALEVFDFRAFKWQTMTERPTAPRVFEAILPLGESCLACVGGLYTEVTKGFANDLDIFNVASETWQIGATMPEGRGDFAFGWYRDHLVTAGGFGNNGIPSSSVFAYDPEVDKWRIMTPMADAHASCGQAHDSNKFCVLGGLNTAQGCGTSVEMFCVQN